MQLSAISVCGFRTILPAVAEQETVDSRTDVLLDVQEVQIEFLNMVIAFGE